MEPHLSEALEDGSAILILSLVVPLRFPLLHRDKIPAPKDFLKVPG